jgi:hypothetical protein
MRRTVALRAAMTRALATLTVLVLLAASPGAALAATTVTTQGGKSGGSSSGGASVQSSASGSAPASGSGGASPETSTAAAPASTAPAVPVTPNGSTNPLSGGVSPVSPTPTPTATATTPPIANPTVQTNGSSTLSGGSTLAIVIGAVVVLGGIAFYIWRDARRRAPARAADALGGTGRRAGSKSPPKPRKLSTAERKRRKRGKAR